MLLTSTFHQDSCYFFREERSTASNKKSNNKGEDKNSLSLHILYAVDYRYTH